MNRIHLGMIDGLVIILYIISLIIIGVFISKQKTKSGKLVSEDIFLGGRTLPWYKVGLSIFSTNVLGRKKNIICLGKSVKSTMNKIRFNII